MFFGKERRLKHYKELHKVKNWYDSVYPLPSRYEKNKLKTAQKTSEKEFNLKSESYWLGIIFIESFLLFNALPYLFFKYFHLTSNIGIRLLGYRRLKS